MGRKLGMESTGSASRGLAGTPGIGAHNLFLNKGTITPEALLADVPAGLYVTELIGQGVNMVTGDYSRGASGLWIENGELTYPVEEITIAGNLKEMLKNISAIADDLNFRGSTASPTIRIDGNGGCRRINARRPAAIRRPSTRNQNSYLLPEQNSCSLAISQE